MCWQYRNGSTLEGPRILVVTVVEIPLSFVFKYRGILPYNPENRGI